VNSDLFFKGILLALIGFLFIGNRSLKEQNERLGNDISGLSVALSASLDTTRNKFGQMQAKTQAIVLSQDQAKDFQVDSCVSFFPKSEAAFSTLLTCFLNHPPISALKSGTERVYYTPYGTLYTNGDSLEGALTISDTVRIAISKGKRKQWWKLWQKRPLETNAFLSSPNGSVTQLKAVLVQ